MFSMLGVRPSLEDRTCLGFISVVGVLYSVSYVFAHPFNYMHKTSVPAVEIFRWKFMLLLFVYMYFLAITLLPRNHYQYGVRDLKRYVESTAQHFRLKSMNRGLTKQTNV